jgi:hypothetical protein
MKARELLISVLAVVVGISLFVYMTIDNLHNNKLKTELYDKALSGDKTAIVLLRKYQVPWILEESVIREALHGNKYAWQILQIEDQLTAKVE